MAEYTPTYRAADSALLGKLKNADMNSTSDQGIAIIIPSGAKYVIRHIVATNASISLTTAVGGIYAAATKTTSIVANLQGYSTLTTSTKFMDLVVSVTTDIRSETTLYLSLTTAQGAAATADFYVFGDIIL